MKTPTNIQETRAIRVHEYGNPEQLRLEFIPRPTPGEGQALIRVHAAGVNPIDWKMRSGALKDFFPKTLPYIPGYDFAGVIEEVGPEVTTFRKGQAVFGQSSAYGTYAEYTVAPIETIALKPDTLDFDEAATISVGATTAWQALFDHGQLEPGQRVLILGAAGGVGVFAVQFAHWKGAYVIGTSSTRNMDFVSSLGAQEVIDYTSIDVGATIHDVDLVFDTVGGEALATVWPALKRGGRLVSIAGQPSEEQAHARDIQTVRFSAQTSTDLMNTFAHMIDENQLKVSIATRIPLAEAARAHELSQQRHGRGRIVLHID